MMKCPICDGKGGWREDFGEGTVLYEPCNECKEIGKVSIFYIIKLWFWQNVGQWFITQNADFM